MIRVLHISGNPYSGGINAHILTVHHALRESSDIEVSVAVLPAHGGSGGDIIKTGILAVHRLTMRHRFDSSVRKQLRAIVRDNNIDILHAHEYRGHLIAHGARLGIPIVTTSHGAAVSPVLRTRIWQHFHLRAMRQRPAVIAVSQHVADWLRTNGILESRIHVIHNAAAPPETTGASRDTLRKQWGAKAHDTVLLYAGRFAKGKGIARIIDAIAKFDDVTLVAIGDGPLRASLKAQAKRNNARVIFTGWQADPWPYYRAADCAVLVSDMEALPMSLIEAQSTGLPAIVTNTGGIPEIIDNETNGLLIPPDDPAALHTAIERMTDPTRRARYTAGAKQTYKNKFTPDRLAADLTKLYRTITATN